LRISQSLCVDAAPCVCVGGTVLPQKSTAGVNVATPLGQRVAANRLAQSFSAFNTNYLDSGLFGVTAVSKGGEHLEDLVWSIMYEMTGLCYSVRAPREKKVCESEHLQLWLGTGRTDNGPWARGNARTFAADVWPSGVAMSDLPPKSLFVRFAAFAAWHSPQRCRGGEG
jgi:hypothetical protein